MTVRLPQRARELLDAPTFVTLTTLAADGSPHATIVWAKRDDDEVLISTVVGRVKERHIRADPRVSASFFDPHDPYFYVSINGVASLTRHEAPDLIQELSGKYTGGPFTEDEGTDRVRVIVRVHPTKVITYG